MAGLQVKICPWDLLNTNQQCSTLDCVLIKLVHVYQHKLELVIIMFLKKNMQQLCNEIQ